MKRNGTLWALSLAESENPDEGDLGVLELEDLGDGEACLGTVNRVGEFLQPAVLLALRLRGLPPVLGLE